MSIRDPKLIALLFNECITNRDIDGLAELMTDDHTFIDRDGNATQSKGSMIEAWKKFFEMFPVYKNTFTRIESRDNVAVILGHAYWSDKQPFDPAIWVATIAEDRVAKWQIYYDTDENRKSLKLI